MQPPCIRDQSASILIVKMLYTACTSKLSLNPGTFRFWRVLRSAPRYIRTEEEKGKIEVNMQHKWAVTKTKR